MCSSLNLKLALVQTSTQCGCDLDLPSRHFAMRLLSVIDNMCEMWSYCVKYATNSALYCSKPRV